jgi:hypothetical protein
MSPPSAPRHRLLLRGASRQPQELLLVSPPRPDEPRLEPSRSRRYVALSFLALPFLPLGSRKRRWPVSQRRVLLVRPRLWEVS